jgi:hypothetical protein
MTLFGFGLLILCLGFFIVTQMPSPQGAIPGCLGIGIGAVLLLLTLARLVMGY